MANMCKRGHDKDVVGVTNKRQCKECHKLLKKPSRDQHNARMLAALEFVKKPLPVDVMIEAMAPWFTIHDREAMGEALTAAVQAGWQHTIEERARRKAEQADPEGG